jgi:uncharacterized surface protein with fasciclin (FAS1) repeats
MNRKTIAAAFAAFALVAGVSACAEDDTDDTTTSAVETTAPDAEAGDIVEVATEAGSFGFLLRAVTAADLVTTLTGEGPFTVLAPTDAAFEALAVELLGEGATLDDLAAELTKDVDALKNILLSHVIAGAVLAADVTALDGQMVETVSGEMLTVAASGGSVSFTINGVTASVTTADIEASNGVIHVIDKVLVPAA